MLGQINTSFATYQADLFESGLVAQIGVNSFAVWSAIKAHANYKTGLAWPSIRRLMELTGLASATVQKSLKVLEDAKLLRSEVKGKSRYYLARERLDISFGSRVICTIVVDYVPEKLRSKLEAVKQALETGRDDPDTFAAVEILPGPGFVWDDGAKVLRGTVKASELPRSDENEGRGGDIAKLVENARKAGLENAREKLLGRMPKK